MTLAADGQLVQTDAISGIPGPIVADLMALVAESGGLVVGRRTHDLLRDLGALGAIPGRVVMVSRSADPEPGVMVARSAREALAALEAVGVAAAVIGGGAETYASFVEGGWCDELRLNIAPALGGPRLALSGVASPSVDFELNHLGQLPGGIAQLHYVRVQGAF